MLNKIISVAGILGLLLFMAGAHPQLNAQAAFPPAFNRVSPELRVVLSQIKPDEQLAVIVTFEKQASLETVQGRTRLERQGKAIGLLKAQARTSQKGLLSLLQKRAAEGKAADIIPYWIFNGIAVKATPEVIEAMSNYPGVLHILPDRTFPAPQAAEEIGPLQDNLSAAKAEALWELGYQGQGIVVANMDTGVSLSHPDLQEQWRGGSNSWFDPHGEHPEAPTDNNGHGTWTMGVIVGRNHSGAYVGIAPEAQWIAVKIFNDRGQATSSAIHAGFQWLLNPDGDPTTDDSPHVINNSWSFLSAGCYLDFQADLRALRAAGILPVFAAGNSGPDYASSVSPANYPEAFSVGAIDNSGWININSSRGPSSCGGPEKSFPDLVAPGVNIYSTGLFNSYSAATGTSMAAPHVAGALALLLNAFPGLSLDQQKAALLQSAVDLGEVGMDNVYGSGSLDILAAYHWLESGQPISPGIPDTGGDSTPARLFLPFLFFSEIQ